MQLFFFFSLYYRHSDSHELAGRAFFLFDDCRYFEKRAWASLVGTLYYFLFFFFCSLPFLLINDCSTFLPLSRRDVRFCVSFIASRRHFSKKKKLFFFSLLLLFTLKDYEEELIAAFVF